MRDPSTGEFASALRSIPRPGGNQLRFLRAHVRAPGRVLTAGRLARAAGYRNYGGINLQYGRLARRIGEAMGRRNQRLSLLVEFVQPKAVTNQEWLLAIRREFATALKRVGWV